MKKFTSLLFILILLALVLSVPAYAQNYSNMSVTFDTARERVYSDEADNQAIERSLSQIRAANGSASAPSYSFASRTNYGLKSDSGGTFDAVTNGSILLRFHSTDGLIIDSARSLQWGSTSGVLSPDVSLSRGAANVLTLASGDYLSFGGATSSFPALINNGAALEVRLADNSARGDFLANIINATTAFNVNGTRAIASTAPTVTSAGTSPSVPNANGTAAFRVNVGTGGTATTIVMAMPTASNGWNCNAENITANAANRANQRVVQQSSTTTAVTLQNQLVSTGAAQAFTASDIVRVICFAY